jgi:hypothetical protein
MGSSISSISFAAASRRPRRSCQRSSTRSDQDRPTQCAAVVPIWTWSGQAAGMAVPAWSGPGCWAGEYFNWRSVSDPIGLAIVEQAGSDRADFAWRSASAGVLINEGREAEPLLVSPDPRPLSRPLNEPWGPQEPEAVAVLDRQAARANLEDRASGPRRGGQPRAARACGIRSRCRSLRDLNRYSTVDNSAARS